MVLDIEAPPLAAIGGPVYRIVSSCFPPVGLWDRIADPAEFDALAEIESLTNERLREELGALARIPLKDLHRAGYSARAPRRSWRHSRI